MNTAWSCCRWASATGWTAGELWLFVVKQRSALALLWFAARAVLGRLDQAGDFETLRASAVEITHARQPRARGRWTARSRRCARRCATVRGRARLRVLAPPPAPS